MTDKSVDVVAIIAGEPAKLLIDMKPESRQYIRLLKFDPNDTTSAAAIGTYFPAPVLASNYPNRLSEDLPALAVRAYLVTYDFNLGSTREHLARLVRALCADYAQLQASRPSQMARSPFVAADLGKGWRYYGPTASDIRACTSARAARPVRPTRACSQQERVLGLCGQS